ncbi:hypothetical protein [Ornithinimicrobium sp. W1665]|uniref:hypothetical protein n=1 Tax=Ornithinimicrobium sp. W1665 TaxID=3416666 RepID=UPI003CEDDDFC
MLVRLIPLLLLVLVVVSVYLLLRQVRSGGPGGAPRGAAGTPAAPGVDAPGRGASVDPAPAADPAARHTDAVRAARELVRQAEAAYARAVARAQERLTLTEIQAERDADGGRAEERVEAARRDLEAVRDDTEELDRARMTLEDLEGAGPLRGDLPSAPPGPEDGEGGDDGGDDARGGGAR